MTVTESDLLDAIATEYATDYIRPGDVTRRQIAERLHCGEEQAIKILDAWAARPGYEKLKLIDPAVGHRVVVLRKKV